MNTHTTESTKITTDIEPQLQRTVEAILTQQGLTVHDAIHRLFKYIATHNNIPPQLQSPNQKTLQALNAEPTAEIYHSARELFEKIASQ